MISFRLADPKLTAESYLAAEAGWNVGHTRNEGYIPCVCGRLTCGCDVNGLALGTLLHRSDREGELAVYQTNEGAIVGVGDVDGPWAVTIDPNVSPAVQSGDLVRVERHDDDGPDGEAIVTRILDHVVYVRFDREFAVSPNDVTRLA